MPYITYKQRLYWTVGWVNRPMGIYHPDYHRYKGSDDEAPDTRSFLQCLPFELRKAIFSYVAFEEQKGDLEPSGVTFMQGSREFCLPVEKIRMSPMLFVCRWIREEYFRIYFQETLLRFIIHAASTSERCAACPNCVLPDACRGMNDWAARIPLPKMQIRLMAGGEYPKGATSNLRHPGYGYHYTGRVDMDDGWDEYCGEIITKIRLDSEKDHGTVGSEALFTRVQKAREPQRMLRLDMSALRKLLSEMERYRSKARLEIEANADHFEMASVGFGGYARWADMLQPAAAWQ